MSSLYSNDVVFTFSRFRATFSQWVLLTMEIVPESKDRKSLAFVEGGFVNEIVLRPNATSSFVINYEVSVESCVSDAKLLSIDRERDFQLGSDSIWINFVAAFRICSHSFQLLVDEHSFEIMRKKWDICKQWAAYRNWCQSEPSCVWTRNVRKDTQSWSTAGATSDKHFDSFFEIKECFSFSVLLIKRWNSKLQSSFGGLAHHK